MALVDNASERQFGAFILATLISSKECPSVIDNEKPVLANTSKGNINTWKEFRNAVVHKGFIPSEYMSTEYCELVYAHINELTRKLTSSYGDEWLGEAQKQATQACAANPDKEIVCFGLPTVLFLARGTQAPGSFRTALENLKGYKEIFSR